MDYTGFLIVVVCCLSFRAANAFSEEFLKRLTQPKAGGFLDVLKPKLPGINFQLGGNKQIGGSLGMGSFGFGFSLGGQYAPPGKGINLPPQPEEPHLPDIGSHRPDIGSNRPDIGSHRPDIGSNRPDVKPQVPRPWENEKGKPRPNWEEYEEDDLEHGSYEKGHKSDRPKLNPYEDSRDQGSLPDWEDIGEGGKDDGDEDDFERKSDSFNNGDLTGGGLIQPRRNRYRGGGRERRFAESHVYHVPLLFRSNAKPFQVRVLDHPNALMKDGSEH